MSSSEISLVLQRSKNHSFPGFSIKYIASDIPKVGFAISRPWGSAVKRNKFKRIFRDVFFSFFKKPPFFFFLVVPKKSIKMSSFRLVLKKSFEKLIEQNSKK